MNNLTAKEHLDTVIRKARIHLYKPIQIAEILYRDRTVSDIDLDDLRLTEHSQGNGETKSVGGF